MKPGTEADIVVRERTVTLGWGNSLKGGLNSSVLLSVDVPVVRSEVCAQTLVVDDTKLCAGGEEGKDSCQGDSGGPLVVSRAGSDVLIGVTSWLWAAQFPRFVRASSNGTELGLRDHAQGAKFNPSTDASTDRKPSSSGQMYVYERTPMLRTTM